MEYFTEESANLCAEGCIPLGEAWAIPDDAEKPDNKRKAKRYNEK